VPLGAFRCQSIWVWVWVLSIQPTPRPKWLSILSTIDYVPVISDEFAYRGGSFETLLDIQVAGRLIEHENVTVADAADGTGEPLQFAA